MQLRQLRRRQLVRELAEVLQAQKVNGQDRVVRGAVGVKQLIQERVRSDGAGARIGKGRTNQECRSSVGSIQGLLGFGSAIVGLKPFVEFEGGQDNGSSICSKAVRLANGIEYSAAAWIVG